MKVRPRWLKRLRNDWRVRAGLLVLAGSGIVLTAFADMFPGSGWVSIPSHLAGLEAGFSALSPFDERDEEDKAIGLLRQGDEGYKSIYSLLSTFDPTLPSLEDMLVMSSTEGVGDITAITVFKYETSLGSIPGIRPVLIQLEGGDLKPVCEIRDLAFLIRDRKVRFWSRLGSFIALIAVLLEALLVKSVISLPPDLRHVLRGRPVVESRDKQVGDELSVENGTDSRDRSGFLLVFSLVVVLGVLVLAQLRRRGDNG